MPKIITILANEVTVAARNGTMEVVSSRRMISRGFERFTFMLGGAR
jgi:hypothetical protein